MLSICAYRPDTLACTYEENTVCCCKGRGSFSIIKGTSIGTFQGAQRHWPGAIASVTYQACVHFENLDKIHQKIWPLQNKYIF